jgi:prepilin-type processing-associated H-X9-DG protein
MDIPLATTPIALTHGLLNVNNEPATNNKFGKWLSIDLYQTKGGDIAFLDGHVKCLEDLGPDVHDKLLNCNGEMTNFIEVQFILVRKF